MSDDKLEQIERTLKEARVWVDLEAVLGSNSPEAKHMARILVGKLDDAIFAIEELQVRIAKAR